MPLVANSDTIRRIRSDCLPCFLDPGHVVFSDNDRDYFARSLDCRRIHSVACRSLQTPTQSAESDLIACPASLILGTLFSQITIETTSRDPSTAAEFTLWHAARCKLRHNPPNQIGLPALLP